MENRAGYLGDYLSVRLMESRVWVCPKEHPWAGGSLELGKEARTESLNFINIFGGKCAYPVS